MPSLVRTLKNGSLLVLVFSAIVDASSAFAQSTNITVTVNGVSTAPGTYNSANIFQATCEGTETTSSTSGDPAIFRLQWTAQSEDTIFWDTAADCNTGNTVTDDAGAVISGGDVTGNITIDPAGNAGVSSYGVGAGNVEIDMRTVLGSAFPVIYGDVFDGGNVCSPAEKGTLYVCVTQQELSTSGIVGTTTTTLAWYMAVNYDTFTPEAPSDVTGQSGDSNVTIDWTFSDSNFPPQYIGFNVYYQPDPDGLVPDSNGVCSPGVATDGGLQAARSSIWKIRTGDGGCPTDDEDSSGICCGDAGVNADDLCNIIDAGPGVATPGVCGGCFADRDCGGNNACVLDQFGNTYCGASCGPSADVDGGNLDCPVGFQCQQETDVGSATFTPLVCAPPANLCIPYWVACGACTVNSDCPSGPCVSTDGGSPYCAVFCSGGSVNTDGDGGGCLGATSCLLVEYAGSASNLCTLPSYDCYDPTLLGTVLDGGDVFVSDAGVDAGVEDAGSGGSGIDVSGWQVQQFGGTLSSAQITSLTNSVCYDFVVQTYLYDGTQGDISSEVIIAPIKNFDFWRLYQLDGGGDNGGFHCQAAGGGVGLFGALALLLGFNRRRRRPGSRK